MASYFRYHLGRIRRFQLRARLGLSIALLHPLPHQTVREVFPHTAFLFSSQQSLLHTFRLSSCNPMEAFLILPCLTSVERSKIQQSPFAPVRLCCPYPLRYYELIRHPLASRFTSSSTYRTYPLLPFPSGTRRASPVDSTSLYPCRR
jgi:hypothetical protein